MLEVGKTYIRFSSAGQIDICTVKAIYGADGPVGHPIVLSDGPGHNFMASGHAQVRQWKPYTAAHFRAALAEQEEWFRLKQRGLWERYAADFPLESSMNTAADTEDVRLRRAGNHQAATTLERNVATVRRAVRGMGEGEIFEPNNPTT